MAELTETQRRDLLIRNWMTHDGLWFAEVAAKYGMAVASPMNLRVCRRLGRIEFQRLMKAVEMPPPRNFEEFRHLYEIGASVFVPDFIDFRVDYPGDNRLTFHFLDCFAHRSMEKAGVLADYQCGIFIRIEGWFDAMGLNYDREPDLERCQKLTGDRCRIDVQLRFPG